MAGIDQPGDGRDQMHQRGAVERAVGGFGEHAGAGFEDGEIGSHGDGWCGATLAGFPHPRHCKLAKTLIFRAGGYLLLAGCGRAGRTRPAMTRPSIEFCIKIFVVALVATFVWTVVGVLGMLG